jgi:hypothetical protein
MNRDGFGDTSVLGDTRWGGAYGVEATFIAIDTVTVSYVYTKDILNILDKDPALSSVKRIFAHQKCNWLANAESVSEPCHKVKNYNCFRVKELRVVADLSKLDFFFSIRFICT